MEMERKSGWMAVIMMVSGSLDYKLARVHLMEVMEEFMQVLGKTISCMEMENSHGQMVKNTLVNTPKTSKQVMVAFNGPTEKFTKACGLTAFNTEKVCT